MDKHRRLAYRRTLAVTLATVLSIGLMMTKVNLAEAKNGKSGFKALHLAGKVQTELQLALIKTFSSILLYNPQSEKVMAARLTSFDKTMKEIDRVLRVDQPGREKVRKYYRKLLNTRKRIEASNRDLKRSFDQTGDFDPVAFKSFTKEASRIRYQVQQFIRHLINFVDVDKLPNGQKLKFAQTILAIQMQGDLLHVIIETIEGNITELNGEWATFWSGLARFDVHASVFKALPNPVSTSQTKMAKHFENLIQIKHGVVITGEAIIKSYKKRGRPDVLDLKDFNRFADETGSTGESLLRSILD